MPCQDCNPPSPIAVFPIPSACTQIQPCCEQPVNAACVEYTDAPLSCIGISSKEKLNIILQRIDNQLCEITGQTDSYNNYNLLCLEPASTEKDFAEKAAAMLCQLRGTVTNFISNLYPGDIGAIRTEITALSKAGFDYSCDAISIAKADAITFALQKICDALCDLHQGQTQLDGVDWDKCATIPVLPQSIEEGFNFILDQLCSLSAGTGVSLPTFDNRGSCLPGPSGTDSLQDTIVKIRGQLCSLPTFSVNALSSSCVSLAGINTLEQTLSRILQQLDSLSRTAIRQVDPSMFSLSDADSTRPCEGKKITLTGSVGSTGDRLVAVNGQDNTPGTLADKIAPGAGILISAATTAGKLTISADQSNDFKVKVAAAASAAGYLSEKIKGSNGEVNTTVTPAGEQLVVAATLDYSLLIDRLFDVLETDSDLKARFCALVASCPSPCSAPTNVQAIAVP